MKKIAISFVLQSCLLISFAQVKVQHLLTENSVNPIGVGANQPRFSWQLASDKRNTRQTAYELTVTDDKGSVWTTGKVASDASVQIMYEGNALQSDHKYNWKVKV
jgi:alpha-L-rhamnosidase